MRAWEGGKWRRSLPGLINVFSLCILVAVSCLQRGPRDQVRGRRATKRKEIINNKKKYMEERKKKKEAEQQPLQRRHRGATATTTEEITAGGQFAPTDRQNTWRHHTGSCYGRAGAKKPANHSHLRKSLLIPQICPQSKQNAPDYKSF